MVISLIPSAGTEGGSSEVVVASGVVVTSGVVVASGVVVTSGVVVASGVVVTSGVVVASGVVVTSGAVVTSVVVVTSGVVEDVSGGGFVVSVVVVEVSGGGALVSGVEEEDSVGGAGVSEVVGDVSGGGEGSDGVEGGHGRGSGAVYVGSVAFVVTAVVVSVRECEVDSEAGSESRKTKTLSEAADVVCAVVTEGGGVVVGTAGLAVTVGAVVTACVVLETAYAAVVTTGAGRVSDGFRGSRECCRRRDFRCFFGSGFLGFFRNRLVCLQRCFRGGESVLRLSGIRVGFLRGGFGLG